MSITCKSIKIRSEKPLDYQAIAQVNTLAFGRDNEAQLVEGIRTSDRYIPALSLVAELDDVIIGHILFSYIDLVGKERFSVLALAPMAVRPEFQKQGVGSKLVRAGLEAAEAMGEPLVVVLGYPWFYPRFGFEPSGSYDIEPPFPVRSEAFMVKPLKNYQQQYKGKVAYPPAFSRV
ncbi:MAG: GNAT family N-acetyltransferase [Xenococcaceae cyanobacterium]